MRTTERNRPAWPAGRSRVKSPTRQSEAVMRKMHANACFVNTTWAEDICSLCNYCTSGDCLPKGPCREKAIALVVEGCGHGF
jgi:hypothetical protein